MNSKFQRYAFPGSAIPGAVGALQVGNASAASAEEPGEGEYEEPQRKIDLVDEVDVIVCGAAAVLAASKNLLPYQVEWDEVEKLLRRG